MGNLCYPYYHVPFIRVILTMAATGVPLTITQAFSDTTAFSALLARIGIQTRNSNRLTSDEGIDTAEELSNTKPSDLKLSLDNINKLFGSKSGT